MRIIYCLLSASLVFQLSPVKADEKQLTDNLFLMSFEDLLNVKVTSAAKQQQKVSEVAGSVAVITANQIKRRGYQYLIDALRDLPGIDLIGIGGAYPNIMTFRGSYGDENKRLLLLVDGIDENSLNGSFEMGGYAYSLHNVERIEVIWGPGSALYGANALSGIINIITKHNNSDDDGFYLAKGIGTFDTQTDKLSFHHTSEQHAFSFSSSWYSSEGPKFTNRHPDFSDAYADQVKSLILRYSYKKENSSTTMGAHLFDSPMGDGTFTMSPTSVFDLPPSGYENSGHGGFLNFDALGTPASVWHPYTQTVFVQHQQQLQNDWSWSGKIFHRVTGVDENSYSFIYIGNDQFRLGRWTHQSKRIGYEAQIDYRPDESQSWISGIQYFEDDIEKGYRPTIAGDETATIDGIEYLNLNASFGSADRLKQNNVGLFTQYIRQMDFIGQTDLTLGIRFDNNQSYGSSTSPRIGLVNRPDTDSPWIFKANYGEAFRAPAVFERFSASTVRVANPDLQPEDVKTFELSSSYQFEKSLLQATLFRNQLDNLIAAVLLTDGKNQNQNVGSIDVDGLEIKFNSEISKALNLMFNYTFQQGKQGSDTESFDIPNIAKHKFNLGLDYLFNKTTSVYISANWVGERSVATTSPLDKVDGYIIANLSLHKAKLFNTPLELNLSVNNLFDEQYVDPGIRSADGLGVFGTVHEQPGRVYSFEISYLF